MNKVYLADFQHLHNEKELLNPSPFWTDLISSRVDINKQYGESLLRWTSDVRKKIGIFNKDASVEIHEIRHFMDKYVTSTEMDAYLILSACHDMNAKGGPIKTLKRMASSKQDGLFSKYENLGCELDTLIKQHIESVNSLQDIKEKGLKAMAAASTYDKRISALKADLERVDSTSSKSRKNMETKVHSLEKRLRKQTEKEQQQRLKYEKQLVEERELVERLTKTTDHACQEAGDLQQDQIEALVSVLRDLVAQSDPLSFEISDRTRPLLEHLDNITLWMNDIVNQTFDTTSKCYLFPDIQAWHETFGFLEKLPTPVIRDSDRAIAQDPKKGLSAEIRLAQEVMSSVAQTMPRRNPWVSKLGTKSVTQCDSNNNTSASTNLASRLSVDNVSQLDDVYVQAVRPFKATHPEHLQLKAGMRIKQKFPADIRGFSFGWFKSRLGGPKTYGFYPADHVLLDS